MMKLEKFKHLVQVQKAVGSYASNRTCCLYFMRVMLDHWASM